jgi:DNA-binding GntR family transcriptional regulator
MSRTGSPVKAIAPTEALADQAFHAIRDAITSGRLAAGQAVTERSLAEFLNVSPTPVREALRQLEHEGLIERVGRDRRVSSLADAAYADMILIHAALRGLSARIAAERATEEQIDRMRIALRDAEALRRRSPKNSATAGFRAFHAAIEAVSQAQLLGSFLATTEAFDDAYKVRALSAQKAVDPKGLDRRVNQHRGILKAIEARNPDLAERLMREHTLNVSRTYIAYAGSPRPKVVP